MATPRSQPIGSFTTGITRLRLKGGASPESLYDLLNGYVDQSGAPVSRDGTTLDYTLPAGTKGLATFKGKLNVFTADPSVVSANALYVVNVLIHPNPLFVGAIVQIHFAKPFLGFLYVVAEFSDGLVAHYWLQSSSTWAPNTMYQLTGTVVPTVVNGYSYKATSSTNPRAWTASTATSVGDVVQPTTANGFQYTCIEVDGDNPTTGTTEPTWPTTVGATVDDDNDTSSTSVFTPVDGGSTGSPAGPRYDNYPGSGA